MSKFAENRRQHERHEAKVKISYYVIYDFKAKVEYEILDKDEKNKKYLGITKNVSAEGMAITSQVNLEKGQKIFLAISAPEQKEPIIMEAEVKWCSSSALDPNKEDKFDIGLKINEVNEKYVHESIYYDEVNEILWSELLRSLFGNVKDFSQKIRKVRGPIPDLPMEDKSSGEN